MAGSELWRHVGGCEPRACGRDSAAGLLLQTVEIRSKKGCLVLEDGRRDLAKPLVDETAIVVGLGVEGIDVDGPIELRQCFVVTSESSEHASIARAQRCIVGATGSAGMYLH